VTPGWGNRSLTVAAQYALRNQRDGVADAQSADLGVAWAMGRRRGSGGRLAPILHLQLAHGTHHLLRAGIGAPEGHALADEAGPEERHQDRDGR